MQEATNKQQQQQQLNRKKPKAKWKNEHLLCIKKITNYIYNAHKMGENQELKIW